MKSRAAGLLDLANDALDRARRKLGKAMSARDEGASELESRRRAVVRAIAIRDEELQRGARGLSFAELDAWLRGERTRAETAEKALAAAEDAVRAAQAGVTAALMRKDQMQALQDRALEAVRLKEHKAERRAEDERVARRAPTK